MGVYIGWGPANKKPEGTCYFGCSNSAGKGGPKEAKAATIKESTLDKLGEKSMEEAKVLIVHIGKKPLASDGTIGICATSEVKDISIIISKFLGRKTVYKPTNKANNGAAVKDKVMTLYTFTVPATMVVDFDEGWREIRLQVEYNNGAKKEVGLELGKYNIQKQ